MREYYKDDEEKLKELETVEHTQAVQLFNSFMHNGQNGKHFCMVFEGMGIPLLEIIKRCNYKGIPLPLVRIINKQILIGLAFCGWKKNKKIVNESNIFDEDMNISISIDMRTDFKETGKKIKKKKTQNLKKNKWKNWKNMV